MTRDNALISAPFNRYSYQNTREFYPTVNIPPSTNSRPLNVNPDGGIERLGFVAPDGSAVTLAEYLTQTWTDSFIVIHGDEIVFERYLNGIHADQPHQMMSVTKSFAGMFGLMAAEAGLVSEVTPVAEIIPELAPSTAFGDATFGQVLVMTNSMDFSEDYADPASGIQQYAQVLGFLPRDPSLDLPNSIYGYLPTLPIDAAHAHGEVFHYQTPKTDVVNWVTNRVTGESFFDQMTALMEAIGAEGETYVLLDKNGTLFAGGGLNATPHNLARFAAMLLNYGMVDDQVIVPESVIEALETGGDRSAWTNGPNEGEMPNGEGSYRAQWWVRHNEGREAFTALGIHGQWIYIDRAHDVAIVRQASQPMSTSSEIDMSVYAVIDTITDYLTGE
ncbi:serine hydrolase [Tropicibacter sp. R16_0]|uniref:serine hydrolase domain-containing protein n=1 Tax=Tropicibacter sp. R16_0 TaxID=2821102 RepID=UPI001AD995D7|nr:serine hydrolase [Tropicibacter sp. R16_0]